MSWILSVVSLLAAIEVNAESHQGTDYVLGFIRPDIPPRPDPDPALFISTQDPRGADVLVEVPRFAVPGYPMEFHIGQFETRTVRFPANIRVTTERDRGIHVVSLNHEAKLDIMGVNDEVRSVDTFLALPCKVPLSRESYYVSDYRYFIFSAISSNQDSSAFLIVPCTSGGPAGNNGIWYTIPGEAAESVPVLLQYSTLLVTSGGDLTGTVITSPFPLAVFSGHQCGRLPAGRDACDHLVEQIPPDIVYGTRFFVLPFAVRESGDVIRVGSTIENNEISLTCNRRQANVESSRFTRTATINSGEFYEFQTRRRLDEGNLSPADYRRDFCCIESSKPAIVMQYMLGFEEDNIGFMGIGQIGDPAMTLVPPVEQYKNNYILNTPDEFIEATFSDDYFSFISWAIATEFFDPDVNSQNFFVNNETFAPSNRVTGGSESYIPFFCSNGEICGYGGTGAVGPGNYQVSYRSPDSLAGVYVSFYGFHREISYANPAGMKLEPIGLSVKEEIGNLMVYCFGSHTCDSEANHSTSTLNDCCKHELPPFGLAYKYNNETGRCYECPVEFGFVLESFTAEENSSAYQVDFAFFSGRVSSSSSCIQLQFHAGTAAEVSDVILTFTRVSVPQVVEQDELQTSSTDIMFRLDPVAQEANETFALTFVFEDGVFRSNPSLRNILDGVVVDATGKIQTDYTIDAVATFEISEECYRVREGEDDNIPVIITKPLDIFLAIPVTFKVIPLTIDQAIEMRLNLMVQSDNQHSPVNADENDFNTSAIIATFPADVGSNLIPDFSVPITVFDDDIDEANNQFFAVTLEVFEAVNEQLISLGISASLCEIMDNDPIAIGFQFNVYDFYEPFTGHVEIMNVTIVKEDDRVSEQTFGLVVTFGNPGSEINAATLQQPDRQNGFDYVVSDPGNNILMMSFKPTQFEANFSFVLFSDNLVEGTEGFEVTLTSQGGEFPNFMQPLEETYSQTLIRIFDTDYVVAGFEESEYTANETDGFIIVCVLLRSTSENLTLEYSIDLSISITGITADELDFDDRMYEVTFRRPNSTSKECVMIQLLRDEMFESLESFYVDLVANERSSGAINFNNSQSKVFIQDNSEFVVGFSKAQYHIEEGENREVTIMKANRLQTNITFTLELENVTAQSDSDYDSTSLTYTISFEMPNITFPLIDDDIFEVDECFQASIVLPETNISSRLKTLSNSTVIVIKDDDVLEFSLDPAIWESEGNQNLTMRLSNGHVEDLVVIVAVTSDDSAGTATVGEDYTHVPPTNLTFTEHVQSNNIPVSIEVDELPEQQEFFNIVVINVTVIDLMGTVIDFSDEIGDRIKLNGTTVIEDRVTLKTIVTCYLTPQCESGGTENETHENCCSQQPTVLNFYFEVPGSLLSRCQPCQLESTTETGADDENVQLSSSNILEISLGVVFGAIGIAALILIILLCIFIKRFRNRNADKNRDLHVDAEELTADEKDYFRQFTVQSSFTLAVPKKCIISSCRLKLVSTVGQGEFGMVYKGYIKSGYLDAITDAVAIKTLKGFVERESVRNLLKECGKMYSFDHPNILKLIGVCMDGGPAPYIIMPFMENGSLKDYLQKKRDHLLLEPTCSDSELMVAVEKNLLGMCSQVAKGMEYLASKRIVHRDLAARNCMIDLNFVIKVADFGLAESLDSSKDYFRQNQDNVVKLPIKWLALESIHDGIFSEKSDVWSFGVTCWEIFNGGKSPYPGIHPADLPLQLDQGLRLEKPNNAALTEEIYLLLESCWISQSYRRPSFSEIVSQLSKFLGEVAGYLDLNADNIMDTEL